MPRPGPRGDRTGGKWPVPFRVPDRTMARTQLRRRPLTEREILGWADAYREATGTWPTRASGDIVGALFENWARVDTALRAGLRGLPGGSSLARLLTEHRHARIPTYLPPLDVEAILAWADGHFRRTGDWPTADSGPIPDTGGEKWLGIDAALRLGSRGLPAGSSLAKLLAERRGVRHHLAAPPLSEDQILAWADAHHRRTGRWPSCNSGPIADAPGETWRAAEVALRNGQRGLPGGSSLAFLLAERRGARNRWTMPSLSVEQILAWADVHHARHGRWPDLRSGSIPEAPGETWGAVNHALQRGTRGLAGGVTLAALLARERGARNKAGKSRLTRRQILAWADAHFRRTGQWPTEDSGPIAEAPGENWLAVTAALQRGGRGLRGGSSLARLLESTRGKRNIAALPPLSKKKILAWADAHFRRTGAWPSAGSGPVIEAPGETWYRISRALSNGGRGLTGRTSLPRLLAKKRGVSNRSNLPALTEDQIRRWAEGHRERTGQWPRPGSGPVADAPGEIWRRIDDALRGGFRGLPGGSSLTRLLRGGEPGAAPEGGGVAPLACPAGESGRAEEAPAEPPPSIEPGPLPDGRTSDKARRPAGIH